MMNDQPIPIKQINKDLPVPFYYQIVQVLREWITDIKDVDSSGGKTLPSETEMCDMFAVNRGTIRHALAVLEREGLIYREKGRGTFIRRRRVEMDLSNLCSTTDDMRVRGWEPDTDVLSISQVKPRSHIQDSLRLKEEEKVWEVLRLRYANSEPISLQRAFFPVKLMPQLIQKDLTKSFYDLWKNTYNLIPFEGEQTIRTRLATAEEADYLAINDPAPIFEITRITYDHQGIPFEYLISIWRGDRYDFFVRLTNQ